MSSQSGIDYYKVLGVPADSTFGAIQKAFFRMSLSRHPDKRDKSESEEAHKEYVLVTAAYNVLKDEDSRKKYDSTRAHRTQHPSAAQRGHRANPSSYRANNYEDPSKPRESQSHSNRRFYTGKTERDARGRQNARNAKRKHPRQFNTGSEDSGDWSARESERYDPYEVPHCEDNEEVSAEEEVWLRFRTAKNNLQGLAFSLSDALYGVLEIIRALRKVEAVKRLADAAREQLRLIQGSFTALQLEIDSVDSPMELTEATATRVRKMVVLEERLRELIEQVKDRPPGKSSSREQKITTTSVLVLKAMEMSVQLCR